MNKKNLKKYFLKIKKFWKWMWNSDSILSYFAVLVFAIVFFKFLLFPVLGFVFNNDYPLVAIVSGSMEHKAVYNNYINKAEVCGKNLNYSKTTSLDFDSWWDICGDYYVDNYNISKKQFSTFEYKNGLNIGDVLVLAMWKKAEEIEVGDNLVFIPKDKRFFEIYGPVIHRIVKKETIENETYFTTKGDHNAYSNKDFEEKLSDENLIAVPILRVPFLGYPKFMLNEIMKKNIEKYYK